MDTTKNTILRVSELQLGDTVLLYKGAYSVATIYKIDPNGDAHVWRPYVHTGDVVYSGNSIIPYIGIEDFALSPNTKVFLVDRKKELK